MHKKHSTDKIAPLFKLKMQETWQELSIIFYITACSDMYSSILV